MSSESLKLAAYLFMRWKVNYLLKHERVLFGVLDRFVLEPHDLHFIVFEMLFERDLLGQQESILYPELV
jgi:hypothetical protein